MCRNIKTLFHFEPPTTREEVRASALQYVRKLSGMRAPSKANEATFEAAVDEIARLTWDFLDKLEAHGPPRSREVEREKAIERGKKRWTQRA